MKNIIIIIIVVKSQDNAEFVRTKKNWLTFFQSNFFCSVNFSEKKSFMWLKTNS